MPTGATMLEAICDDEPTFADANGVDVGAGE